jgi:hypothetical protein
MSNGVVIGGDVGDVLQARTWRDAVKRGVPLAAAPVARPLTETPQATGDTQGV